MDIRVLKPSDIPHVQQANITNLPENYFCKYYLYHAMSWPQLSYVAVDVSGFAVSLASVESRIFLISRHLLYGLG
jgi:ribosomal protein S18 acetylase RimI-like enzyme